MKHFLIAGVIVLLSISGHGTADYTLTIQTDPPFITTVNPFIGMGLVSGSLDLDAEPFVSCPYVYRFDHWEGQGIVDPDAAHTSVLVEASQVITAVYVDDRVCGDVCHPDDAFGDLNHDCIVNLGDIAEIAARWLNCTTPECDTLPSLIPDPSTWLIEPRAVAGSLDAVEMQAVNAHNISAPDAQIEYSFDCLTDDAYDSGWVSDPYYHVLMAPGTFLFSVSTRDDEGHSTQASPASYVSPGSAFAIPTAEWKVLPNYSEPDARVSMEVQPYQNYPSAPALPAGYGVKYRLEKDGLHKATQIGTVFTDVDIADGNTYVYRVRMGIYHIASGQFVVFGGFSDPVSVLVLQDKIPPVPTQYQDPLYPFKAQFKYAPSTFYRPGTGFYYNNVESVLAEDPAGVEYRFLCSDSRYSSGTGDGPLWRNSDNVADLVYPDSTPQVPHRYVVSTGSINKPNLIWYITYRDRSPNHNRGDSSDGWSATGPNPVVVVNP